MFAKHLIDKVLITLESGDVTTLFILVSKDGSIHRKGNGSADKELPLAAGVSRQGHFEALMMTVDESIFHYAGVLKMPERLGVECRLTMVFQGPEGIDYSFRVVYGNQSEGPPNELVQILINAVKITEPWYTAQLTQSAEKEDKWWKVW